MLLGVVLIYTALGLLAATAVHRRDAIHFDLYSVLLGGMVVGSLAALLLAYLLYVVLWLRPARPVLHIWQALRRQLRWRERLAIGAPLLFTLPLFFSVFTSLKNLIPVLNPYHWDPTLVAWDRALMGGEAPWQRLSFLLHWPWAIIVLNVAYNLWFVLMYVLLLWQAFSLRDLQLRCRFLLSYLLVWMLLGTLLATLMSSAGPCYYGRLFGGPDPYAPLMSALTHIDQTVLPLWALRAQQMLWQAYSAHHLQIGVGISAMPSMHLANALLFALLLWSTRRSLGVIALIYVVVLVLGSVILGWHYLVDSVIALPATAVIWWAVGRLPGCGAG